jgi:hypothetical protein
MVLLFPLCIHSNRDAMRVLTLTSCFWPRLERAPATSVLVLRVKFSGRTAWRVYKFLLFARNTPPANCHKWGRV